MRMRSETDWRPTASLETLQLRAGILARIRAFFADRDVLEVDTPALSHAASTDPDLLAFNTLYTGPGTATGETCYLHTSPEYPMKRLLAAGIGSVYQVCKVFRNGEFGRKHNPEFTLLEWYRTRFDYIDLMEEVEQLLTVLLADCRPVESVRHWTYRELFVEVAGIDPFTATSPELSALLASRHAITVAGLQDDDKDAWLDLVMTHVIEPRMGAGLVFVRDFPASQALLARLRPGTPPVAARFEIYLNGIELANGFHELVDAAEQRQRFENDLVQRSNKVIEPVSMDEHLLSALQSGLPDCAGVALGLDRLLMVASGATSLKAVMAFPFDSA